MGYSLSNQCSSTDGSGTYPGSSTGVPVIPYSIQHNGDICKIPKSIFSRNCARTVSVFGIFTWPFCLGFSGDFVRAFEMKTAHTPHLIWHTNTHTHSKHASFHLTHTRTHTKTCLLSLFTYTHTHRDMPRFMWCTHAHTETCLLSFDTRAHSKHASFHLVRTRTHKK